MIEFIMKPFIYVYHLVRGIYTLPSKVLKKESKKENYSTPLAVENNKEIKEDDYKKNLEGLVNKKEEKKKKQKLNSFKYTIINANGKKVTDYFEAETIDEVRNYLTAENYKILKLEPKKSYDIEIFVGTKLKPNDLSFALIQLSTYIKAGIPLVDAVKILAKQATKPLQKRAFEGIVVDLLSGEDLSEAMEKQGERFPKLLINMIKTAEMTGDLASILDDMAEYYTSMEKTRKEMVSAMTYPVVVLVIAVCVLVFMLIYIVPQFVSMFESQDAELPWITLAVMNASDFLKANYLWVVLAILIFIFVFYYFYKNIKSFRKAIQTMLMHIPVISKIIIYNEVTNFTKTFASLLNHGVLITDSMEILSKITNNEIYKEIIAKTLYNLGKGNSISESFKGQWAFPVVAYEMLVTGENTGQLGLMMEKVSDHYQTQHKAIIDQLKSLIEPLMIVVLAVIVGIILLSIVVPMFDIYGKIE